jgi:hypothetical protein
MHMWSWLSDPNNQKTLAFLGGGIAAFAGAAWTVFTSLRKKRSSVITVTADHRSMAAGHDLQAITPLDPPRRSKPPR